MLHYCRSKAEKVFRPWWDTLEDYLLNSLVLLGEPELSLFAINIFSIHIIPMKQSASLVEHIRTHPPAATWPLLCTRGTRATTRQPLVVMVTHLISCDTEQM